MKGAAKGLRPNPDAAVGGGPRCAPDRSAPVRVLSSASLLAGGVEVAIEHEGERYRLRRTSRGKLILTK